MGLLPRPTRHMSVKTGPRRPRPPGAVRRRYRHNGGGGGAAPLNWVVPRTWVTGELVTAAMMNEQVRDNLIFLREATNFGAQPIGSYPGDYYTYPGGSSSTTLTQDLLHFQAFFVPDPITIDRIGLNIVAGAATSNARVGIYRDDGTFRPGTLVVQSASLDTTTTDDKETPVTAVLTPGIYWWAVVRQQAGNPFFMAASSAQGKWSIGSTTLQPENTTRFYTQSGVSGTLPTTANINGVSTALTVLLYTYLRVVA